MIASTVVALGLLFVAVYRLGRVAGGASAGAGTPASPPPNPAGMEVVSTGPEGESAAASRPFGPAAPVSMPGVDSTSPDSIVAGPVDEALGPNLVVGGTFASDPPEEVMGDGVRVDGPDGRGAWRMTGPDDQGVSFRLEPTPGHGLLRISWRMIVPPVIVTFDEAVGGVQMRARLIDRHGASAVADQVVKPTQEMREVAVTLEDSGTGPYTLWIEATGYTNMIFLDDVEVRAITGEPGSAPSSSLPSKPSAGDDRLAPVPAPTGQETVEEWFTRQPFMTELAEQLPAGVTLEVFSAEMAGSDAHLAVEVRENHAAGSGFDPGEAPRWGIFQVSKDLKTIFYLSPVTNRPEPVEVFMAEGKLRVAALTRPGTGLPGAEGETELERWVRKQDWFRKLEGAIPEGITLRILPREDGFEGWTEFEIREHHSRESGFDPDAAPLVGLFEVSPTRDGIGWYDPVSTEWQPIEDFLASRGLSGTPQ